MSGTVQGLVTVTVTLIANVLVTIRLMYLVIRETFTIKNVSLGHECGSRDAMMTYTITRPHRRRAWTVQFYSPGGAVCTPPSACFLRPIRVQIPNGMSISSAVFAQPTEEPPSPPQNCPFHGDLDPNLINDSLGPPSPHLDRFSRFCRAHYYDRPTDHATRSITIGRIYVRSMAIRPKNAVFLY